jgi:excisionase family DNA binding protein
MNNGQRPSDPHSALPVRLAQDERRAFFTPKTLAEYLAVSERTVREMLSKGVIPSYRVAGTRRIKPDDVDAYLERNRTPLREPSSGTKPKAASPRRQRGL